MSKTIRIRKKNTLRRKNKTLRRKYIKLKRKKMKGGQKCPLCGYDDTGAEEEKYRLAGKKKCPYCRKRLEVFYDVQSEFSEENPVGAVLREAEPEAEPEVDHTIVASIKITYKGDNSNPDVTKVEFNSPNFSSFDPTQKKLLKRLIPKISGLGPDYNL